MPLARGGSSRRAGEGDRKARWRWSLSQNPDLFLPTAQIGISVVSALGAAYGGHEIVQHISSWLAGSSLPMIAHHADGIGLAIFVVCFTYVSLILGELVPKRASLHRAEGLAILLAPVVHFLAIVARPVVWFMGFSTSCVLWMLGLGSESEPTVSLDDIEHMIDTGTAEGVVEPFEQKLALGALRLGERSVRDIMRPRIDLDAMGVDTPADEILGTVAMAGFSRLPVYEGDLDHVIGFVHIKDLFRQQYLGWAIELRKLLHPALFVPENMTLDRLLALFQEKHNQLAIVLNEYGGTEGMVTLEDVVEEIVGEMRDEHRRHEEQKIVQRDDKTWLLDGAVSIADMIERLEISTDEPWEGRGFSTVAGLILDRLGHIPSIGDKAEWDGLDLEVVDMDGQRIDRVLITRKTEEK